MRRLCFAEWKLVLPDTGPVDRWRYGGGQGTGRGRGRGAGGQGGASSSGSAAAVPSAPGWDEIVDAGRDNLDPNVPRELTWTTQPRSREYMNMEKPYDELHRRYWQPVLLALPPSSS